MRGGAGSGSGLAHLSARARARAEEEVGSWAAGGAIGPTASEGGAGRSRAAARDVGGELSRGAGGRAGAGSGAQGAPADYLPFSAQKNPALTVPTVPLASITRPEV